MLQRSRLALVSFLGALHASAVGCGETVSESADASSTPEDAPDASSAPDKSSVHDGSAADSSTGRDGTAPDASSVHDGPNAADAAADAAPDSSLVDSGDDGAPDSAGGDCLPFDAADAGEAGGCRALGTLCGADAGACCAGLSCELNPLDYYNCMRATRDSTFCNQVVTRECTPEGTSRCAPNPFGIIGSCADPAPCCRKVCGASIYVCTENVDAGTC